MITSDQGTRRGIRKQRMKSVRCGQVLSLLRAHGEWLAIVAAFTSPPGSVVISNIVPIADLKGSARRKADRWVRLLV